MISPCQLSSEEETLDAVKIGQNLFTPKLTCAKSHFLSSTSFTIGNNVSFSKEQEFYLEKLYVAWFASPQSARHGNRGGQHSEVRRQDTANPGRTVSASGQSVVV